MICIDVVFHQKEKYEIIKLVHVIFSHLDRLQFDSLKDGFTDKEIKLDGLVKYFSGSDAKAFLLCNDKEEIFFKSFWEFGFSRLCIRGFFKSLHDATLLIEDFVKLDIFLQSRIYDYSYDLWENMEDIQYYESEGVDHSALPKKANGRPFPLNREIIDISSNPGRWKYKKEYLECVGSFMWIGENFWSAVGQAQKRELLAEDWIQTEILANGVIKLVASDQLFIDETTADKQNRLREILYGSLKILH